MNNIKNEYEENKLKIKALNEKIDVLNLNSIEVKLVTGMCLAIIPWLVLVFLSPKLITILPPNLVQLLTIAAPTLIGFIGQNSFQKKFQTKEKLKKFSKAKSEKERDKEVIAYEIEREKLINYNKILNNSNTNLAFKNNLVSSLALDSKDKLESNIDDLNKALEDNKKKLDIISCKNVLKNNFFRIRDKFQNVVDKIGFTFVGGFAFMVLYYLPILAINNFSNIHLELSAFQALSPFLIGSLGIGAYFHKRRNDEKAVFNFFNNKLGKDALSDKINDTEKEDFSLDLDKIISDSSFIRTELEALKEVVNETSKEETEGKHEIKTDYDENTKEIVKEEKSKVKKLGTKHDLY